MVQRHDHWIDGRHVAPAAARYLQTVDPTTCEPGDEVAAGTAADVGHAVAAARAAQPAWAARPAAERAAVLLALAEAMLDDRKTFLDLERACTGKTDPQLDLEFRTSVDYLRYYAGVVRAQEGRTIDLGSGVHAYTRLVPYGVVAVITPWNLPLNQACRSIAPALAIGNAVLCKPSEFTSLATLHLAATASRAGLPSGLLNVVTGAGADVGAPLVAHPDVARVSFTGSVATGRAVAVAAAGRLVPSTLELGGKSPIVVLADADLDGAAAAATRAVVSNAGQVCSATTRLLAHESVHDAILAKVVERLRSVRPGIDFGPIITEAQYRKVLEMIAVARAGGLEPVVGGDAYPSGSGARGRYIQPTVFASVPREAPIAREEVFGPVLVTLAFRDDAEALALANDSDYGLVASVWSGDLARALRLAERIEAGQVSINGGPLTEETPFGGFKQSGYGREKGLEALHEYAQVQVISAAL